MVSLVSTAFLCQARADFVSFERLREYCAKDGARESPSQWLHFLQMAIEKTGKVYEAFGVSATSVVEVKRNHAAFTKFIQQLPKFQSYFPELAGNTMWGLKAHIRAVVDLANALEKLQPQLAAGGPNVEYPWDIPGGGVGIPCAHQFNEVVVALNSQKGRSILNIVRLALYDLPAKLGISD